MLIYDNEVFLSSEETVSAIKDSFYLLDNDSLFISIGYINPQQDLGYKLLLTDIVDPNGTIYGMTKQVLINTKESVIEFLEKLELVVNIKVIKDEGNTEFTSINKKSLSMC